MSGITVKTKVHFRQGRRSRKELRTGDEPQFPAGRVPRVSKLMALAVKFEQMVQDRVVADYAELARLGHVSRARISQIMNLLNLAPDIQEAVLNLPVVASGREPITERDLRAIVAVSDWRKQRQLWYDIYRLKVWAKGSV